MKKNFFFQGLVLIAAGLFMTACTGKTAGNTESGDSLTLSGLNPAFFATDSTALYALTNPNGMEVCFTNFGGRIVSIMVPDKNGNMTDVCLGHDDIDDYMQYGAEGCNFGALIGRYGNRIAKGQFTLDGESYQLPINNGPNSLHGGGPIAFHNRIWDAKQIDAQTLEFTTFSADGEDGYPGNINVKVTYTLTDDNALQITYQATTDKATVLNLTNHCYFNLSGDGSKDCLNEVLWLDADKFTAVDADVAVTGEVLDVEGTPFDFRTPTAIGERIDDESNEQIVNGHGYDHNWILNASDINKAFASLYDPNTGIFMEMFTDQPGVQFYAGNFLDGSFVGKNGVKYPRRSAFCFETQHYPDSPNHPEWPSTTLRPGEEYLTTTIYKFSTK
ncbi:MAG: galactose mutarotase [Bacteroidaceae bacterium]|nr:galactose mutarotase [Bacteroidaceae bacterium]MBR4516623.1 galactose mutarotase [Bacteroidaceae bacterium]